MAALKGTVDYHAFMGLPCRRFPPGLEAECAICHEGFNGTPAKLLPCATFTTCPSFFHADCLLLWLERQRSCPLCRRSFEGELGTSPSPCSSLHWSEVSSISRPTEGSSPLPSSFPSSPTFRGRSPPPASAQWPDVIGPGWEFRRGEVQPSGGDRHTTTSDSVRHEFTLSGPAGRWLPAQELLQRCRQRRSQPIEAAVGPTRTPSMRRTLARTSPGQAWAADSSAAGMVAAARRGPRLFTNTSSLDADTRRTLQSRVAALHRLQFRR